MSERLKTILKIALTAGFLAVCIFLPSVFAPEGAGTELNSHGISNVDVTSPSDFSQRAELFMKYWAWESDDNKYSLDYSKVSKNGISLCVERRDLLLSQLDFDIEASVFEASAMEWYYTLSDGAGNGMNLVDYYYQWEGDWRNWLVITMDIDTQDIYRAYFSTVCLRNFDRYAFSWDTVIYNGDSSMELAGKTVFADLLSEVFGECMEMELAEKQIYDSDEDENRIYVFLDKNGMAHTYGIRGHFYNHPELEAILIDYTILCQSDA